MLRPNFFEVEKNRACWLNCVVKRGSALKTEELLEYFNAVLELSHDPHAYMFFDKFEFKYHLASWFFNPITERDSFYHLLSGLEVKHTGAVSWLMRQKPYFIWKPGFFNPNGRKPSAELSERIFDKHIEFNLVGEEYAI